MDSRLLPEAFTTAYEFLNSLAMDDGTMGENHPLNGDAGKLGKADGARTNQWRDNSGQMTRGLGKSMSGDKAATKRVGKTSRTMRSERLFRYKQKVDKRLRRLATEMFLMMQEKNGENDNIVSRSYGRNCVGTCRRIGELEWKYCPNCGGMMMDMDRPSS